MRLYRVLIGILTFFVSICGFIIGKYNEIILSHQYPLIYPIISIFEPTVEEKTISDLVGNKNKRNSNAKDITILVLDESQSLRWKGEEFPPWYFDTVNELKDRLSEQRFKNYENDTRDFDLCKVNLFQNLFNIENQDVRFAVYKLGDEATKIYPPEDSTNMDANSDTGCILKAINLIHEGIRENISKNTNYTDLFNKILKNHLHGGVNDNNVLPTLNLVIISDLLHDVMNKKKNELIIEGINNDKILWDRVKKDKQRLEETIKLISNSKLAVDFIVLEEAINNKKKRWYETYILDSLRRCRNYEVKKISIKDYYKKCLLRAIKGDKMIDFSYSSSKSTSIQSSFRIKLDRTGEYMFGFENLPEHVLTPDGEIQYHILDSGNNISRDTNKNGYLKFGEIIDPIKVEYYEKIQLDYEGSVPDENQKLPAFKIYLPEENRRYYSIPSCFKEKLSSGLKILFLIAYMSIILIVIYFIIMFSLYLIRTR